MSTALRVAAGLLLRDGRVLIARRGPAMDLAGCWEFPGGKIEAGETAPMALERELDEELGIRARATRHLATSDFHSADGRPIRLEGWLADPGPLEPEAREHDAIAWRLPAEIDRATLAPADGPLLDALIVYLGAAAPIAAPLQGDAASAEAAFQDPGRDLEARGAGAATTGHRAGARRTP